jgi:hypothetical protein
MSVLLRQSLGGPWAAVFKAGPALPLLPQRFVYGDPQGATVQLFEIAGVIGTFELALEYGGFSPRATHKPKRRRPYTH